MSLVANNQAILYSDGFSEQAIPYTEIKSANDDPDKEYKVYVRKVLTAEERRRRKNEYNKSERAKLARSKYNQKPEVKQRKKLYAQKPEIKKKRCQNATERRKLTRILLEKLNKGELDFVQNKNE